MKRIFVAFAFVTLTLFSFAQEATDTVKTKRATAFSKNYFYLSPFNLIAKQFLIGYERDFGKKHSLVFQQGAILGGSYDSYYNSGYTDWGVTSELQYRFHIVTVSNPREKARNNFRFDFYTAPFIAYQFLSYYSESGYYDELTGQYVYSDYSQESHAGSFGILFGTRFTFFERFTLDAYTGGGMKISSHTNGQYSYDYDIFKPGYRGIIGKANLQIGVAF